MTYCFHRGKIYGSIVMPELFLGRGGVNLWITRIVSGRVIFMA